MYLQELIAHIRRGVVEKYISEQTFIDGDRRMENYRFAVSHDEPAIQVSDVVVGLLGKFYSMLLRHDWEEVVEMRESLNARQEASLSLLRKLRDRSLNENQAFAHVVLSLEDRRREALFLDH